MAAEPGLRSSLGSSLGSSKRQQIGVRTTAVADMSDSAIKATPASYEALATLYNALMTGLVLSLLARCGEAVTRDFVQAHFRRQHTG